MLSQDGLLRFIDIHACKQLFEIGGADEVLYPNEKVSSYNRMLWISTHKYFFPSFSRLTLSFNPNFNNGN